MLLQRLIAFLMSGTAVLAFQSSDPALAPLAAYRGTWQVSPGSPSSAKPYQLVNDCSLIGTYFACQQTVDGKVTGLLVIMRGSQPGHFATQIILPEGRATGRDDLEIAGDRWTWSSSRLAGGRTTYYRTVNTFVTKDRIHYEQADSTDGKQWTIRNSGDQRRIAAHATKR